MIRSANSPFLVALVTAFLVVAAIDLGVRAFETRLSGDIANMKQFSALVEELSASEGARVAAVGNSLIGDGLDAGHFMSHWLDPNPGQGRLVKLVPDGSSVWDWYCIANLQLASAQPPPDLLMIGFGWNQLSDQSPINLSRTFNGICPASALPRLSDLSGAITVGDWLKMATVKTSKLYAHREAIRHRVLQNLVPNYRRMTRQVNARAGAGEATGISEGVVTYSALEAVLGRAAGQGTEVVFIAMPVQQPYELDPGLCIRTGEYVYRLVDMRTAVPANDTLYRDNLHLNANGAQLFSERLAAELRDPTALTSVCRL